MTEPTLPPELETNVEYAGPWASADTAADYLGCSLLELEAMRQRRETLGCTFSDRQTYYPVRQFVDGKVLAGLQDVLDILLRALPSENVAATWLAGPADDGTGRRMWGLLAEGDVESVLVAARQDAALWNR